MMERGVKNANIYLAVLPLQNMSEDPTLEMFCEGLVMDLITDLSRFRSFQIISYDAIKTLFPSQGTSNSPLQDLHLDYLVKGMARYHQEKLFINLQLINARQNRLVWAEKFSGSLEEIFLIQEEMTKKIVVSLQHFVDNDLLDMIRKKPLTNLNAYECWLRGYHELKKGTVEADEQARVYFAKAMDLDPHFARAYTGMSLTYFNEWSCQLWSRWEVSQKGAFEWAQKAVELDEWDHISTAILGRIYLFIGEYDKAEHFLRKALRNNPNDAESLTLIATGLTYLGYPEEGLQLYRKIRRLNPADDSILTFGAFVNFEAGRFDEAISLGEKIQSGKTYVDFPAFMAAAYYHKGDLKRMTSYWQDFLHQFSEKINQGKPADTQTALQWMIDVNPYRGDTQLKAFCEYMKQGDLPVEQIKKPLETVQEPQNCFIEEAGLWTISFSGKQVQIPELKGFYDLAKLLGSPNATIHCQELMGVQVIEQGEVLFDHKAKKAYQHRILELQQGIEEAESFNDIDQSASLQREYDQLLDHLSKSLGMGGKARKVSGTSEKARSAVTWRIRKAIRKISEVHPQLGKHLEISIKTGLVCSYSPEAEVYWIV